MDFTNSKIYLQKAVTLIPSASQTYSKSYRYYCEGAAPAFLDRGEGARVCDVDGNEFIDFVLALGPVTLGYNNPGVNTAIKNQLEKGISFSQPHHLEIELAEKLADIIPCAEMVKFVKNGSDATAAAVRLERAYTERDMIACCGYHGFHDWFIGSTIKNRGVPEAVCNLVKTFEYNNPDSLQKLFEQYPGQIAGVIMEPIVLDPPQDDFLQKVKELTHANGSVLIFDEIITGFRLSSGGAQKLYNVIPDLAAFGKGIANGMPLSVVAGQKKIMRLIDEGVFVSTTFGGETLSLAAALATISILEQKEGYSHMWNLGEKWLKEADELINKKGLSSVMRTAGLAPHSGVVFSGFNEIPASDWLSLYQQELILKGILTVGINNYCLAHSEKDIEVFIKALDSVLDTLVMAKQTKNVVSLLKGGRIMPIFKRN